MADDDWSRTTTCKDAFRRDGEARVTIGEDNLVVLVSPPGDATVMTVSQVTELRRDLGDAQLEALNRSRLG
jgi:hypothetical protein